MKTLLSMTKKDLHALCVAEAIAMRFDRSVGGRAAAVIREPRLAGARDAYRDVSDVPHEQWGDLSEAEWLAAWPEARVGQLLGCGRFTAKVIRSVVERMTNSGQAILDKGPVSMGDAGGMKKRKTKPSAAAQAAVDDCGATVIGVVLGDQYMAAARQIASWAKVPVVDAVRFAIVIAIDHVAAFKLDGIKRGLVEKKPTQRRRSRVAR